MDLKAHLSQLEDLLIPHQKIWGQEIIHHFPNGLNDYPTAWLAEAQNLSHFDLWQLDCNEIPVNLGPQLQQMLLPLQNASQREIFQSADAHHFDPKLFFKVKEKKYHEVCTILNLLSKLQKHHHRRLVDIGSGQGHLTRICAEKLNLETHAIESNSEFIHLGRARLKKSPLKSPKASLKFHQQVFGDPNELATIITDQGEETILLGLHTCGPLAIDQLRASQQYPKLTNINIPCCYQRITDLSQCNLSGYVRLAWSSYALTLAARAHGQMSYSDFCHKERVKYYRYALHWFLLEFYQRSDFQSVGDSPQREYRAPFSHYVKNKLQYLNLAPTHEDQVDADKWYLSSPVQHMLQRLFIANIIRWRFGQALEQVLLLDRALWMQDKGLKVKIEKLFDSNISPRSHAITVLPR
jgi:hypothetical protein